MPHVAILYDHPRWEEKAIALELKNLGASVELVNVERLQLDLASGAGIADANVYLQRCLSFFKGLTVSGIIEELLGGRVVNTARAQMICGHKALTTAVLARRGLPVPRAYLALSREAAKAAAAELGYPVVIKPVVGSWGRLVAKVSDEDSLDAVLEDREVLGDALVKIHYVQEYVRKPQRDIRVFVVGDSVPVAIYRVNPSYWKTNTHLGGRAEPAPVTDELRDLALRVAEAVGGEFLGIDVFEDPERGLLVNEVNANTDFRNTVRVTGFNLARAVAEYLLRVAKR